jgi:hypothetical protein
MNVGDPSRCVVGAPGDHWDAGLTAIFSRLYRGQWLLETTTFTWILPVRDRMQILTR